MNTPAHAIINLAILGRKKALGTQGAIFIGSLLPDAPMFWFYFVEKVLRETPERQIWQEAYYRESWQGLIDLFNSAPLMGAGLALCLWRKLSLGVALFASMLLHVLGDFPVHHDDSHRHLFPFSDWRFESPLSYWDPAHFGHIVGAVEVVAVIACCVIVFRSATNRAAKALASSMAFVYISFLTYALMMWA